MKKFTSIKELYPNEYQKFYPQEDPEPEPPQQDRHDEDSFEDTELAVPEPRRVRFANPIAETKPSGENNQLAKKCQRPGSKESFTDSRTDKDTSLKGRVMNTLKSNLINIVILLVGFLLVSNDAVLGLIDEKITKNSIAGMAIRGLGLVVFYIAAKIVTAIVLPA
jgi:hypothetical protein